MECFVTHLIIDRKNMEFGLKHALTLIIYVF